MSAEYQVKKQLEKVIENAYFEHPKLKSLKYFILSFEDIKNRSYSGTYSPNKRRIRVIDIRGNDGNNILTLFHELAHHVDYVLNGKTGHQKPFYDAYRKIIYSALDLDFVSYEKLKGIDYRNVDYKKVMKILDEYRRNVPKVELEKTFLISVYNSFDIKDALRDNGYYWNNVSKAWYKDILEEEVQKEKTFIYSLGKSDEDMEIKESSNIEFKYKGKMKEDYVVTIIVTNSFDIKDFLRERGYFWDKLDKGWKKGFSDYTEGEEEKAFLDRYKEDVMGRFLITIQK